MTRWVAILALLIAAAQAQAIDPGAVELPDQRTEYTTTYRVPGGLYAVTSDARPAHWWDGSTWRDPDPVWRDGALRGIPGPLVWRLEADRIVAERRSDGVTVGAIGWRAAADGWVASFDWQGLPCTLTADPHGQKLACAVSAPLGRATLRVPVAGDMTEAEDGAAIVGGLWRLDRLAVVGADGIEYPGVVSAWRAGIGSLSVHVDDRGLPPGAFPYVIDPSTGPNLPTTCAALGSCTTSADCPTNATCTGSSCVSRTAWTNPTNAQTSNNVRASVSLAASTTSAWLKCTNYGFTTTPLADDKIIKGIVSEQEVNQGGSTINIVDTRAVKADGTLGTSNRATGAGCVGNWTTTDVWRACGSSLDTWGVSWTPADIRDVDFGTVVAVKNASTTTTRTASVDAMRITIYYSPPAGRVYATGWDSYGPEDGAKVGSPEYVAGAARTGGAGLRLSAIANTSETWAPPSAQLDSDLTDRGYSRWYWKNTPTLAAGSSLVVAYAQEDTNVGCYLRLNKSATGCLTYQTQYHGAGSADVDFGEFTASSSASVTCATDLAGTAVAFGQVTTASTVACPLYVNGRLVQNYALEIASDCSGSACDLSTFILGSPATGAVGDYSSFPAYTLDIDDLTIDNLEAPGVGYVAALYPTGSGASVTWSNTCGGSVPACVDDWATGVEDACYNSADTRQKNTGTGVDLYSTGSISPALTASDAVAAVRTLASCCGSSSSDGVRLYWRSGTTELAGPDVTVAGGASGPTRFSYTMANDFQAGEPAWTESTANSLQVGAERFSAGASNARCSAVMKYVDVTTPTAQADRNLQDVNGDGHLTAVTWCDSITAGTRTSTCESTDGTSACTAPCSIDGDCDGGQCISGACVMECETNADCTCGTTAQCLTANNWVNQFSLGGPQIETLINCGRNAMPLPWAEDNISAIIGDPYTLSPPCRLIRGDWGHCSSTTAQACSVDGDCPTGQTCVRYAADYVIGPCGANNYRGVTPSDCKSTATLLVTSMPAITDYWGHESCPRAATSDGTWRKAKTSCTVDADCAGVSPDSKCRGSCNGHSDPIWPCLYDGNCSTCSNDATQHCGFAGFCISNGAKISQALWTYERCNDDTDCSAGTCQTFASLEGAWNNPYRENCTSCTHNTCDTATKYCTIPCSAVSCSTDADCAPPGGTSYGTCNTGTGKCAACGAGEFFDATESDTTSTAGRQMAFAKRLAASPGNLTPDKILAEKLAVDAAVRAAGARYIDSTYAISWQNGQDIGLRDAMERLAKVSLARMPIVADTHFASRFYDDRIGGGRYGELVGIDGTHNASRGASVMSSLIAATVNTLYPVCSGDTSDACGFCDVACTTDQQAAPPVTGTSPTPTAVAGACRTATPAVKVAGCSTSANCGSGCACEDVQPGAGTDLRCVCEDILQCPAGDNTTPRRRVASDALCASGTCSSDMVPPLCTMSKIRCATTADCQGYRRGDVCAVGGIWQACEINTDCTRDGGKYADPVCAGGTPVVGTSPTPQSRVCQQPTPTP